MADTIKEVLDFALRFDTKQATREMRSMDAAFKALSKRSMDLTAVAKKGFEAVTQHVAKSRQEFLDMQKAYKNLATADHVFINAAVKSWSKIEGVVEDSVKAQEKYLALTKDLTSATEKLTEVEEELKKLEKEKADASKAADEASLAAKKALAEAVTEQQKAEAALKEAAANTSQQAVVKATKAYEKQKKAVESVRAQVNKLTKSSENAGKIAAMKGGKAASAMGGISEISDSARRASERMMARNEQEAKAVQEFQDSLSDYDFKEAGKDIWGGMEDGIDSFKSKDPLGIIKSLSKMALKPIAMGVGKGIQKAGVAMGANSAMADMSKIMGKMGPMISALGGALVGLVKLFLDADAAAKEFNRDLLQGGSTAEFLTKGSGKATDAMGDLSVALKSVRDAAMDYDFNNSLGITSKEHSAFLSTLQKEGKTLQSMAKDADAARMQLGDFSKELLTVGVTYSRNFGVSLDEIGQLTGQLMTETGMSLKSVETAFGQVLNSSKDSGIGANKFFNIIRSMSGELTLFTFRLEEAAQVLKAVGKAMSARNAEKFLQTVSQFYKGMGFEDRIKQTLMGGGAQVTGQRLTKGFEKRNAALAYDVEKATGVAGSGEEMKAAIAGSKKDLAVFLAKYGDKMESGMRESIIDAQRLGGQAKGGLVNVSSALRGADMGTVIEQLNAISKNMVGSKLSEAKEINYLRISKLTGLTEEQIDMFNKLEMSMDIMRQEMAERVKAGKATKEDKEFLQKAGVKDADKMTPEELQNAIQSIDDTTFFNSLSESQQKAVQGQKEVKDYAKMQTDHLQDLNTKIQNLMDFMTNTFYNAVMGIWETLVSSRLLGSDEQREAVNKAKELQSAQKKKVVQAEASKAVASYSKMDSTGRVGAATQLAKGLSPEAFMKALEASGLDKDKLAAARKSVYEKRRVGGADEKNRELQEVARQGVDYGDVLNRAGLTGKALDDFFVSATGATPGTVTSPSATPATQDTAEKQTAAVEAQTQQQAEDSKKLHKAMRQEGIKIDKSVVEGPMKKATTDATLEALRKALFEQYLYKDVPVEQMIKGIQSGNVTEKGPGDFIYSQLRETGGTFDPTRAQANAEGGLVKKPAVGEYFASVAPGETIVPKGGGVNGPTSVQVNINNVDSNERLKTIMEAKVRQGIAEYRKQIRAGD